MNAEQLAISSTTQGYQLLTEPVHEGSIQVGNEYFVQLTVVNAPVFELPMTGSTGYTAMTAIQVGTGVALLLIKGLEDDEYTVTEIKTADGYTLLKKGIAVVISRKDASASATVDGKQAAMLADNGRAACLGGFAPVGVSSSGGNGRL